MVVEEAEEAEPRPENKVSNAEKERKRKELFERALDEDNLYLEVETRGEVWNHRGTGVGGRMEGQWKELGEG